MKQTEEKVYWYGLTVVCMMAVCFLYCVFHTNTQNTHLPFGDKSLQDFPKGWTTSDHKQVSLTDLQDVLKGTSETITVSRKIPDILGEAVGLNFRSKNINFVVYINNQEVYRFEPQLNNIVGKSYGSCFHYIPIREDMAGGMIAIVATPAYADNGCFFNMMVLGDSGEYYQTFMRSHFWVFLVCVIIMVFGVITLLLPITMRGTKMVESNLNALGIFALMLGCWTGMQTLVPQMLMGYMLILHGLNYLILIFLPYPAMRFVNSLMIHPKKRYDRIIFWMVIGEFVICVMLNYFHISDYHESLKLVHLCLAFTMLFFIYLYMQNQKAVKREQGAQHKDRSILTAFVILSIFVMLDLFRYVAADNGVDDAGFYGRIGLLVFIIILFLRTIIKMIDYMKKATKTEIMEQIAYTDSLTKLPNRAAFVKKEEELQKAIEAGELSKVLVCQLDINDLKLANDTFGHAYGDVLIKKAAEVIQQSFGDAGFCYRVGGDEFTVFLTKEPVEESYRACIAALEEKERLYNECTEAKMPLSIAYGECCMDKEGKNSMEEAEQKADQLMYQMKKRKGSR